MSLLLTPQAENDIIELVRIVSKSSARLDAVKYTDLSPSSTVVTGDSLINIVSRVSVAQMLTFTENHPIRNVVQEIYNVAVSLELDPCFCLAEAILETGWGTSYDAKVRHNWYGYEAYFKNPAQAKVFPDSLTGIKTALTDIKKEYCSEGGDYYQNGEGATIIGWATKWINGGNTYVSRVNTITTLMNDMIKTKP